MSEWSLSRDAVRTIDRTAVEQFNMPSIVLMENAGRGTADVLEAHGITGRVVLGCGKGNNGGDGLVIARHLENRGHAVRVLLFADPDDLAGDAAMNCRILQSAKTPMRTFPDDVETLELDDELREAEWIVDALLGTGMTGSVREPYATIIDAINTASKKVLAVDVPSGMNCDTGEPLGSCIRADHTATFVARKQGFNTPAAAEWTGTVHVVDIGVPKTLLRQFGAPDPAPETS